MHACQTHTRVLYTQVQHVLDERAVLGRVGGYPFIINLLATFQVRPRPAPLALQQQPLTCMHSAG
jgi:hypothetical protein